MQKSKTVSQMYIATYSYEFEIEYIPTDKFIRMLYMYTLLNIIKRWYQLSYLSQFFVHIIINVGAF